MNRLLKKYEGRVCANILGSAEADDRELGYWQDQLFCHFLAYCWPISLIALIPGVYMALRDGLPVIAAVDLASFSLIFFVTFVPGLTLRMRKITVITVFYTLAIFLINTLGYLGPGVFYLFFITVLAALFFPVRYAVFSVLSSAVLLALFSTVIAFKLFDSALILEYTTGKWVAFSANLVFASAVTVLLIDRIFKGLQLTITNKTQLQERYQQIFYKSPLPMWLFDTDTFQFLDVNEAALKHYGYSKPEFLAMTIMDIRPAESVRQTAELVRANKLSGQYYGGVSQHLKKTGEMIYVNIESNLLSIDGRQVRLVQAADITTQLEHQLEVFEANRKVRESESKLRALFDSAIDGFVLLDEKAVIKLFNPKALDAMRFNKGQRPFEIGCSIFDYVETSRIAYFREIMARVYQGETIDYDRMFRTRGIVSWIRYTVTPVLDEQRVSGACITGRDVTARKLYLQSVEEQNKTFREISWMQSHLVRAPLARIMGLLPMLSEAAQEKEKAEIIDYLKVSAGELDAVIHQITEKSAAIIAKYPAPDESE
jgi:PAS domain S-box-containing protein